MASRVQEIKKRMRESQLGTTSTGSTATTQGGSRDSRIREIKRKMVADVDGAYIQSFINDARDHIANIQREYQGLTWQNARSEEANVSRANAFAGMNERIRKVNAYLDVYREDISEEQYTSLKKYLEDFNALQNQAAASFRNAQFISSQYETEDAYKKAVEQVEAATKNREAMHGFDIQAGEREIAALEEQASALDWTNASDRAKMTELSNIITQKQAYLNRVKRVQEGRQLGLVNDPSSEYYDPEFEKYSGYRSTVRVPIIGTPTFGDETYEYINNQTVKYRTLDGEMESTARSLIDTSHTAYSWDNVWDDGESPYEEASYSYMNNNEVAIYNYNYAKYGKDAADKYLDSIQETLNYRKAIEMYGTMEGGVIPELAFGVVAGLDQFGSGIKNLFNFKDDYIPQSATQMASGMVREDLEDVGPNLPGWLGGASLGQVGYDTVTTTANMAPSILASVAVGTINPKLGSITGNVLMGASAAGNAYQEKLNLGYSKEQARTYGLMIGVSEAVLGELLGGISKLGGGTLSKVVLKNLDKVDNIFSKFAKSFGGKLLMSAGQEAFEEGLQSVIEPYLWEAVSGEEASVDWQESFYSALLGFATGGLFEGSDMAITAAANKGQRVDSGSTATDPVGGVAHDEAAGPVDGFDTDSATDPVMDFAYEVAGASAPGVESTSDQVEGVETKPTRRRGRKLLDKLRDKFTPASAYETYEDVDIDEGEFEVYRTNLYRDMAYKAVEESKSGGEISEQEYRDLIELLEHPKEGVLTYDKVLYALDADVPSRSTVEEMYLQQKQSSLDGMADEDASSGFMETQPEAIPESQYEASGDGNMHLKSSGEAVSIKGIASIKNGRMTLETEDGKTIDVEDVSFSSADEASVYEAVAEMNLNASAANLMVNAYHTKPINGDSYSRGIREAYSYGKYNISRKEMMQRGSFVRDLTEYQREVAYRLGQIFAGKQISREVAAINQRKKNGQKTQGAVHFNGDRSRLNDTQRAGLDAMELLAKGLGIQFYVFESQVDSNGNRIGDNGRYDPKDGSIHVDLYAGIDGKGTILFTVAHELTHYIRQWSPAKFKILANYLMEQYGKKNEHVDELIADQIAKAERTNRTIDRDEAFEELVADSMETMLNSGNVLQMMADMKQRDRTLWEKICDWFKDFADKLKNIMSAYGDVKPDSTEGRIVAGMQDATVILEALYGDALLDAAENFDAGAQKNTAEGGVKYSFAGRSANSANLTAFEKAQKLAEDGRDGESIRQQTGWFQGMDGKWRFEIDDSAMQISDDISNYMSLGDLLHHPKLYRAYPDMRHIEVVFQNLGENTYGSYNPQFDSINLDYSLKNVPEAIKDALIHELQHAIQNREGFTRGATVDSWERKRRLGFDSRRKEDIRKAQEVERELHRIQEEEPEFYRDMLALDAMAPDLPRGKVDWNTLEQIEDDPIEWQQYDARREELEIRYGETKVWDFANLLYRRDQAAKNMGRTGTELYFDTAGEIEARDVENRRRMSTEQRKSAPPKLGNEDTVFSDGEGVSAVYIGETKDGRRCYQSGYGADVSMDKRVEMFKGRIATIFNLGAVELKTDIKKIRVRGDKFTSQKNIYGDHLSQTGEQAAKVNSLYDLADILATAQFDPAATAMEPSYANSTLKPKNRAHKDVKYWYKFRNEIVFDGVPYTVTFNIRDKGREQYQYLIDFKENKTPGLSNTAVKNLLRADQMPYSDIVAPPPDAVKVKMPASDSAGNQLSEAQQEYFRGSQIRDKEGRLLVLYHQTDGDFTIFDARHAGAGNNDSSTPFGIFLKRSAGDIGLTGKRQMALYANITNPLRATNREDLDRQLREFSSGYTTISDRLKNLDVEYQRKIEQAQTAWNDYVKKWREAHPNAKRTDLYGDPKFNELFNAEDELVDEWTAISTQLSVQAKEIITEDLRNAGYDGIFLEEDVGSWGRRTDAIIALDPEQVKDINNQNPTDNPDIRYSTRDPAQQKIQEALQEENTQLREDVSRLEELIKLQRTVTGGTKFTKTSVIATARLLKKYANVKRMADTDELAGLLHTFYEAVASDSELSWDKIKEWSKPVVQWLQDHVDLKEERSEYAKTILDQMKGSRIYLDESQRAEAAYRFGSYNDFCKALFGRITFVDKGDTSLDSWWHSMADMFPDVFHPDTTSTDMPGELFDIIDQLKNADTSRVEYEYNRASIAMDLTRQVYDSYWRVSTLHTVADRVQEKINRLRSKHYQQMARLRTEKNAKIDRIIAENRAARERSVDSRRRTEARHKILRVARELDALLRRDDKKHHVPDSMKKAVAAALDLLELDTVNAAERIADYDARIAQATDQITIDALTVAKERVQSQGEKIGERLKELHAAYAEIMKSTDPDISAGYDPVIDGNLQELAATIGDTPFSRLSLEQLEDVYSMYKMVLTRVRDANKSLTDGRNATISQRSLAVIRQIRAAGGSHKYLLGSGKANAFAWNNLKPIYAIEKLGSPELKEAFWSLIKAEGGYARDINQAAAFSEKMRKDYGYDKWDMKKKYSFTSTSGIDFELTLEQIMSLYAFSRREQALDHLRIGGFVFDSSIETYKVTDKMDPETGEKKQKRSILKYRVNTADAHQLSQDILADIVSVLDPKQSEFVEKMQAYLSDTMGAKGNEVSMAMYGIKLFKEKHYWPLKSSNSYMFQQNETAGEVRIKNAGFTQKTKPNANNPIVLQNFMDVWAGHVHDMSMYHSFTLPLEDFNRIFNFATPRTEGQDPAGVKMSIQNAYGKEAVDYVRQMIVDLNGGARSDTREGMSKQLMGRFKKAAVAASLSVAIQQPSALNRAKALIPDKYFITLNPRLLSTGKLWEECKTYAPVAMIKEMGKFDMDTGIGTINYIKAEKKGFMDVVDDVTGWLPAKADEWTWVQIWSAVKKETAAKNPDLTVGSKEFLEAAGERFTEVIVKTQVYDSTLSRSAFMRSKSGLLQMTTAFMAEPTTSINMIEHAIWQAKRGYRQASLKTCRAVLDSVIANAVLVSLIYALRDDDEDETFVEKYFGALTTEIIDGLNPLTYIPWVKDVWSIAQGFDVERSDMSLFADIADSISTFGKLCAKDPNSMNEKELSEHKRKVVSAVWGVVEQAANFFGLPVRNVRREIMAAINTFKNARNNKQNGIVTNPRSFWTEVEECLRDAVPVLGWFNDSKTDQIYDAVKSGDVAQINRLKNTYRDEAGNFRESAYKSAVRKGLRENDPRIRQAARARLNKDFATATKLLNQIAAEGHFDYSDIAAAIKAEYNHLKDD